MLYKEICKKKEKGWNPLQFSKDISFLLGTHLDLGAGFVPVVMQTHGSPPPPNVLRGTVLTVPMKVIQGQRAMSGVVKRQPEAVGE